MEHVRVELGWINLAIVNLGHSHRTRRLNLGAFGFHLRYARARLVASGDART